MRSAAMVRCVLAGFVVLAVSCPRVVAQVIAYEPFNYTAGANLNGLGGGTGWATVWSEPSFGLGNPNDDIPERIQAGGLSFGGLGVAGNSVVTGGRFSYDFRNLGTTLGTPGTTRYASFLLRRNTVGPDVGNNGPDYGGVVFGDENNPNSLFVGKPGGGNLINYALENGVGNGQVSSSKAEALGVVALLVARFDFTAGNDVLSLYVNPAVGAAEPSIADAIKSDMNLGTFIGVSISTGAFATWSVDELRVGNTYLDVTAVPEPGSAALVLVTALSAVGFHARRRRRVCEAGNPPAGDEH
jgi:hypothetical protein